MNRLVVLPVGSPLVASTRYRILAHMEALGEGGLNPKVKWPAGYGKRPRKLWRVIDLVRDVVGWSGRPFIFVQRKMYPSALVPMLFRGRPFVLDIDDAVDLPPPGRVLSPQTIQRYRRNFVATTRASRLVICGNAELARRLPPGCSSEILATPVDCRRFSPDSLQPAAGPTLGWVGHSDNLPFLESLLPSLLEIRRRFPGLTMVAVSDRKPHLPGIKLEFRKWALEAEVNCFSGITIGLAPLADNEWTRGKCAYRLLQYMALGIPAVSSPVGMNAEVVRNGIDGFLAANERDWIEAVSTLIADPLRAAAIAARAREKVLRDYDLPAASRRLLALLREAIPGT